MGYSLLKNNTVNYDEFVVVDPITGNLVTGLTDLDFTRDLYNPTNAEVSGSITVSIVELGDGKYRFNFTPNMLGSWALTVYHATYFPYGKTATYLSVVEIGADVSAISAAVWDEKLQNHAANRESTGYRLKHVTGASTTKIINKDTWTVEEKNALVANITTLVSAIQDTQKQIKTPKTLSETDLKSLNKINDKSANLFKVMDEKMDNALEKIDKLATLTESLNELKNESTKIAFELGAIKNNEDTIKSVSTLKEDLKETRKIQLDEINNISKTQLNEISKVKEDINKLSDVQAEFNKIQSEIKGTQDFILKLKEETQTIFEQIKGDSGVIREAIAKGVEDNQKVRTSMNELETNMMDLTKVMLKTLSAEQIEQILSEGETKDGSSERRSSK